MKKNPIYSEPALIALLCLPFIYLLFIWNQLPATIPGHYGANGHPDRYDSKELLLAVFGVGTLVVYSVRFLPQIDPKGNLLGSTFSKIRWLIVVFWSAMVGWFWYISLHGVTPDSMLTIVLVGISLLLAGIGNFMYNLKPSFFMGLRTPWTLSNDLVWRKTHHLAGWLWVAGGLTGAVLAWLLPTGAKMPVSLSIVGILVLIPVGYSYWIYRQLVTPPINGSKSN